MMKLLVIALNGMGCVGEDGGSDQTNVQCRAIQEYHKNLLPKTEKLGTGGLHVPDGKPECLPEPECLFYRSVQGKDSGKNQALTILGAR
jgi:hypothetical protein